MSKYADIIDRLEKATGPNYDIECAIHQICAGDLSSVDMVPPNYTASIDTAAGLVGKMLPGWGWRVATCCVSDDAFVFADFNSQEHGKRLLATIPNYIDDQEWSDYTDIDQRPPGRVAIALLRSTFKALSAIERLEASHEKA